MTTPPRAPYVLICRLHATYAWHALAPCYRSLCVILLQLKHLYPLSLSEQVTQICSMLMREFLLAPQVVSKPRRERKKTKCHDLDWNPRTGVAVVLNGSHVWADPRLARLTRFRHCTQDKATACSATFASDFRAPPASAHLSLQAKQTRNACELCVSVELWRPCLRTHLKKGTSRMHHVYGQVVLDYYLYGTDKHRTFSSHSLCPLFVCGKSRPARLCSLTDVRHTHALCCSHPENPKATR